MPVRSQAHGLSIQNDPVHPTPCCGSPRNCANAIRGSSYRRRQSAVHLPRRPVRTHAAELRYWENAGVDLAAVRGDWYKEVSQGMGPALNTASAQNAYVLADLGTWLSFRNRGALAVLVAGDPRLFNQYGVMLVNPAKYPHVKAADGQAFIDWLISPEGQKVIGDYKVEGQQLFFPNANPGGA